MDNGVAFEMMRDAIDDPAFLKRVRTNLDQVLTEHGVLQGRRPPRNEAFDGRTYGIG